VTPNVPTTQTPTGQSHGAGAAAADEAPLPAPRAEGQGDAGIPVVLVKRAALEPFFAALEHRKLVDAVHAAAREHHVSLDREALIVAGLGALADGHERVAAARRSAAQHERQRLRLDVAQALGRAGVVEDRDGAGARPSLGHRLAQEARVSVAGHALDLDLETRGGGTLGNPVGGLIVAGARLDAMEPRQRAHALERARSRDGGPQLLEQLIEHAILLSGAAADPPCRAPGGGA